MTTLVTTISKGDVLALSAAARASPSPNENETPHNACYSIHKSTRVTTTRSITNTTTNPNTSWAGCSAFHSSMYSRH